MSSTLNAAFQNSSLIYGIYVALILAYGLLARPGRRIGFMAIAVINHGGLIGLAVILAIPFISPFSVGGAQVLIGIFIEVFCAVVFFMSSLQIIKFLRTKAKVIPDRYLLLLILFKLTFFIANYIASNGQYGIFADGSRIDFLIISPLLARTWYLDLFIDFIVSFSILLRYVKERKIRVQGLIFILFILFFSFLSGSKGAAFLMFAYVMLFIYAAFPRILSSIPIWVKVLVVSIGSATIFGYVYFLSELLQVSFNDQFSVTLARFLLSADARIMAFDPDINNFVLSQSHGAFLSELFRGPARILGLSTAEFPIGVYQYQYEAGTSGYVGSTNQLSAMFVIYGDAFWVLEFFVVGGIVWLMYWFLRYSIQSNKPAVSWVAAASLFLLSDNLAKGFDAFVQLLPICVLVIVTLIALPRFRWMPRRVTSSAQSNGGNMGTGAS
jgi:hypothetical protein